MYAAGRAMPVSEPRGVEGGLEGTQTPSIAGPRAAVTVSVTPTVVP